MRIGIITFHHAYNYGAFLQARGLQGYLQSLGHFVEIIDYRNPALAAVHERSINYGWNPLRKRANKARKARFVEALACLDKSPLCYVPGRNDWSRYDTLVFGSDEIWNYSTHAHGFDPVYFSEGVPPMIRKLAYAPSLGELDASKVPIPDKIPGLLESFQKIAVRDANAAMFVKQASGLVVPIVLDPVFLFHDESSIPELAASKPYVLVYGCIREREYVRAILLWARQIGCKTVSIGYPNRWCDETHLAEGPYGFLAWLRSARAVVTTTFHGTMFSLKFGKPFVTIRMGGNKRKLEPLLGQLNLDQRVIDNACLIDGISPDMDANGYRESLTNALKFSTDWLSNAVGDK